jgi:hypothetical protein
MYRGDAVKQIRTLLQKDFVQNSKPLFLLLSCAIAAGIWLQIASPNQSEAVLGFLVGLLVFGLPIILTMWLVGQEKSKGTLNILRVLPLNGTTVMLSKWIFQIVTSLAPAIFILFILPLMLHRHISKSIIPFFWIVGMASMISGLFIALFTVFEQKIATQVAWIGGALLFGGFSRVLDQAGFGKKLATLLTASQSPTVSSSLGWLGLVLVGGIFTIFAGKYMDQQDWSELRDDG